MNYSASGKLLLFGEYLVLKGSECLAIPLRYGQRMKVESTQNNFIKWTSKVEDEVWFSSCFSKDLVSYYNATDRPKAEILLNLLKLIKSQKPDLFREGISFRIFADYPLEWGLGSSSTLISLLAQWCGIDPYFLLEKSFGGSGYDIACCSANSPIIYRIKDNQAAPISLSPEITSKLLFVYSKEKQSSADEVKRFKAIRITEEDIYKMDKIVSSAAKSEYISDFERLVIESENLISGILGYPAIKGNKFNDYPFTVKSLGAWGGDFFMATYRNENEARDYFNHLGYSVHFNYSQLIKN
jgi:mevalonate kinase